MDLEFTKRGGKYDDLTVTRADGTAEHIKCPKQGIIPHDMVHYAVETVMARRGFLTRLAEGESAAGKMAVDVLAESIERLVEVMQGAAWSEGFRRAASSKRAAPWRLVTAGGLQAAVNCQGAGI